ncbi:oligomycin resistance ATP-dependent permease Yor1p [[Candida] jaroonii]|uniref:Oligomycin resistance ATP-dependent permease Yor1p n=1 Tax=[Candida] jaroonii TaxID=467808 RepID=A0ACA9YB58_9ASCO|nr:oligomycin resistance ATP-dependent permease Yor1p [[Candida] jaroonii]
MELQKRSLTFLLNKKVPPIPEEDERKELPEIRANFFSKVFFWWFVPIMNSGYKRTLAPEDLFYLNDEYKVKTITDKFNGYFEYYLLKHQQKHIDQKIKNGATGEEDDLLKDFKVPKSMVLWCFFLTFKVRYTLACIFVFLANMFQCLTPLLTKKLITFVEERVLGLTEEVGKGVGYAIGSVAMVYFAGLCINHGFYRAMFVGAEIRALLTKAILDKSFKLNAKSRHDYPTSKITSMMGTDASRIDFAAGFQPFLLTFIAPFVTIIVILIVNIGVSALVGIALLIVFLVVVGLASKKLFAMRAKATKFTDLRVDYIKEVLNNLKVIKFYSWEEAYHKNISDVRSKEMGIIFFIQSIRNIIISATLNLSILASMAAFLVLYALGSSKRNAANIFSSLSLFNVFTSLVFMVPMALASLSDALIGIDRIGNFLAAEELQENEGLVEANNEIVDSMDTEGLAIKINKATFEWETFEQDDDKIMNEKDEKSKKSKKVEEKITEKVVDTSDSSTLDAEAFPGLNNIDFNIKKGEFVVITGLIGSGKSSLLNAVSGFMKRTEGTVDINGSMVLCGQPWIQNTTVKENILFGSEFDDAKYKEIIYCCSLESDLEILPAGDRTEIGERGITLSGGQKARINLARSVYADKDIILLDDVLSAVDARVGKHIMESCILGLLKDKTRILATHQLSLIGAADRIIFLNGDGSVSVGSFEELDKSNEGFKKLMAFNSQKTTEDEEEDEEEFEDEEEKEEEKEFIQRQVTRSTIKTSKTLDALDEEALHKDYNLDETANGRITEDESRATDGVGFGVYLKYFKLGEGVFKFRSNIFLIILTASIGTFCTLFTNTWLSFWTEYKFEGKTNGFYIGIYVMFTILSFIFVTLQFTVLGYSTNQASKQLNLLAIEKVLYSPMAFLDTTPMGRILNRFTKDTDVLDNELGDQLRFFSFVVANVIGVLILCIIYLPWFAIAIPPVAIIFYLIAEYYQSSAREVKRIESIQRSFVYNNFNETLVGMNTIKAYRAEDRFLTKNEYNIDRMNEAYYLTIAAQRWVGITLELLSCLLPLIVTLLAVFRVFHISASSTGLVVSYILNISGQVAFFIRIYTQVENGMNSTERLFDFAYDLKQEAPYKIEANKPDDSWPQKGGIEFNNASLAYRPGLPLVLKNLDFNVKPQEKIGICGRTGAGKSSIMTALYRLSELDDGNIKIDGVDISNLGLKDLRSKLSIIPQDPVLFRGSIRKNLDPFNQQTDAKLWDALRRSGLIEASKLEAVSKQSKDDENLHKFHLEQSVEDDGSNFSLGERQLIALARALVRDSKILILDEATSSVDYETDAKIQQTIVNEFGNCTILCIAHRLKTIIDYDKILVLDKGELKEFDTPWNLFNTKDSIFQQMCLRSKIQADDFERRD